MHKKTKKALEELQEAISGGEFDEFFKDEQRIINYLNAKVKRMVDDLVITPELESKFIQWLNKRKRVFYKNPNIWYGLLNIVIEEGELKMVTKQKEADKFLISVILWRGYTFKQYWVVEHSLIVVLKGDKELITI